MTNWSRNKIMRLIKWFVKYGGRNELKLNYRREEKIKELCDSDKSSSDFKLIIIIIIFPEFK